MTGVLCIIPYITALSPNSLGCALSSKYVGLLFVAEEGVDTRPNETLTRSVLYLVSVLSSFFLIEGAGREKLSCWAFIKIKSIKMPNSDDTSLKWPPVQMCQVCARDGTFTYRFCE